MLIGPIRLSIVFFPEQCYFKIPFAMHLIIKRQNFSLFDFAHCSCTHIAIIEKLSLSNNYASNTSDPILILSCFFFSTMDLLTTVLLFLFTGKPLFVFHPVIGSKNSHLARVMRMFVWATMQLPSFFFPISLSPNLMFISLTSFLLCLSARAATVTIRVYPLVWRVSREC